MRVDGGRDRPRRYGDALPATGPSRPAIQRRCELFAQKTFGA